MYPFSVSNFSSPGHGVLYILIGDLTLQFALVKLTLLCASKPHLEKYPGIVNPIKWEQTIQVGLLVILQSQLRGWVINIDFIITIVRLNNKRYIFWYCIFIYDDIIIFDLYFNFISFIIIIINNFESVISCHFCKKIELAKELHIFQFPIWMYTNIGKHTITIT